MTRDSQRAFARNGPSQEVDSVSAKSTLGRLEDPLRKAHRALHLLAIAARYTLRRPFRRGRAPNRRALPSVDAIGRRDRLQTSHHAPRRSTTSVDGRPARHATSTTHEPVHFRLSARADTVKRAIPRAHGLNAKQETFARGACDTDPCKTLATATMKSEVRSFSIVVLPKSHEGRDKAASRRSESRAGNTERHGSKCT